MESDGGSNGSAGHGDFGGGSHGGIGLHDAALLALHTDAERRARRRLKGFVLLVVAGLAVWLIAGAF